MTLLPQMVLLWWQLKILQMSKLDTFFYIELLDTAVKCALFYQFPFRWFEIYVALRGTGGKYLHPAHVTYS